MFLLWRELFSELISEIETLAAAMGIKYEKSLVKINLDILDAQIGRAHV